MSDSREIDNTGKHYEPKLYLRGFTIPETSQVCRFDKQQPERGIYATSIDNVSVSRRAYTVENDNHLKARETEYGKMLKDLLPQVEEEGDCRAEDIKGWEHALPWFADFVLTSLQRSSGRLSPGNPLMQEFYAEAREKHRETWEIIDRKFPDLDLHNRDIIRQISEENTGINDIREWIPRTIDPLGRSPWSDDTRELLEKGTWAFHRTNMERHFITGDNPVSGLRLGDEPEYRHHIYFSMPMSENVLVNVLCGDAVDTSGRYPILGIYEDPASLELKNLGIFESALRFVYSSSEHELERAIRWSESGLSPSRDQLPQTPDHAGKT